MGRKNGGWFSKVKKAFTHRSSKDNKAEKATKTSMKLVNGNSSVTDTPDLVLERPNPPRVPPLEEVKLIEAENANHAYSVAIAAASAAAAAAQAASMTSQYVTYTQVPPKSKAEIAAVRIQTAFRGYLARRAFRGLRGLVRLKSFIDGPIVKRQTSSTLKRMQVLSHVQSQIHATRARMLEENRALQRQLLQKRAKELESLRIGEEWDDSLQSKERLEENLLHKYEAAMRRERALAYSYTHQQTWKKSTKQTSLLFMDPTNPQWGWSWLERWMASQPNDTRKSITEKEQLNAGEITKSFARHQLNSENNHPSSPATPTPKMASSSSIPRKTKSGSGSKTKHSNQEDDSRSTFSIQSYRNTRRHTISGSSIGDDESLASSPSVPSYMAPTHSAKAKFSSPSPLGVEDARIASPGSAKKRLSYPPSPGRPRRSGSSSTPRKVDAVTVTAN